MNPDLIGQKTLKALGNRGLDPADPLRINNRRHFNHHPVWQIVNQSVIGDIHCRLFIATIGHDPFHNWHHPLF